MSGQLSGIGAGTYSVNCDVDSNHRWPDNTITTKVVNWTINKATATITLSKTSVTLNATSITADVTVTYVGDGELSVTSSNETAVVAELSGNVVHITGKTGGTVSISVKAIAGQNYKAASTKTISVTCSLPYATLSSNTWDVIGEVGSAGTGANYWSIGDMKSTTLSGTVGTVKFSSYSIYVILIGINHNQRYEGNGLHFMFGNRSSKNLAFVDSNYGDFLTSDTAFTMNHPYTKSGWETSTMRKNILGNESTATSPVANTFYAALATDFRRNMKQTPKYTYNSGSVTVTYDWVWLVAYYEYLGGTNSAFMDVTEANYQEQYPYFRTVEGRTAYKHTATSTLCRKWLRSMSPISSDGAFCNTNENGRNVNMSSPDMSQGIQPIVCIAS